MKSHENNGDDHQSNKLQIVKQILLVMTKEKYRENRMENVNTNVNWC